MEWCSWTSQNRCMKASLFVMTAEMEHYPIIKGTRRSGFLESWWLPLKKIFKIMFIIYKFYEFPLCLKWRTCSQEVVSSLSREVFRQMLGALYSLPSLAFGDANLLWRTHFWQGSLLWSVEVLHLFGRRHQRRVSSFVAPSFSPATWSLLASQVTIGKATGRTSPQGLSLTRKQRQPRKPQMGRELNELL